MYSLFMKLKNCSLVQFESICRLEFKYDSTDRVWEQNVVGKAKDDC